MWSIIWVVLMMQPKCRRDKLLRRWMRFLVEFQMAIQLHLIRKCMNCFTSKFWKKHFNRQGFFNKFFQVAIETCEFLKANLNLLSLSRTTYRLCWVPEISFSVVNKCGNSLKLLQKNICCYWSILLSSLSPHTSKMWMQEKELYFSVLANCQILSCFFL